MKSIVGIFNSFADATRGAALLRTVGISEDHIAVLSPHTPEAAVELRIPTTETEQPGMGQALGGAIGAGLGVAGGISGGTAVGRCRVPGGGLVRAFWFVGVAFLGRDGAPARASAGGA